MARRKDTVDTTEQETPHPSEEDQFQDQPQVGDRLTYIDGDGKQSQVIYNGGPVDWNGLIRIEMPVYHQRAARI